MADVTVLIFHPPPTDGEHELVRILADVRSELTRRHAQAFRDAGARDVQLVDQWHEDQSFGEVLAQATPAAGGLVVLSGGAVPLLDARDAERLVKTAASGSAIALTNNRYSSDVCSVANAAVLRDLPQLPSDNALPRWLEERAGYEVEEMGSRTRLAVDLDTPLDIALAALSPSAPEWLKEAAREADLHVPRLDDLRALAADPHRELLVFGRSSSATLRWLEKNVRCRVRFLAEERGMRASSPLAIGGEASPAPQRGPKATLGLLLEVHGPDALGDIVRGLADGAVIDSRVLLAHRLGADEARWPSAVDRFSSDLHRATDVADPWLSELTDAATNSRIPILLGGHSLVGPGVRLLLGSALE